MKAIHLAAVLLLVVPVGFSGCSSPQSVPNSPVCGGMGAPCSLAISCCDGLACVGGACTFPQQGGTGGGGTGTGTSGGSSGGGYGSSSSGGRSSGGSGGGACRTNQDCTAPLLCDELGSGRCVACRVSNDCFGSKGGNDGGKAICNDGVCVPSTPCTSDIQCKSLGMVCSVGADSCVACNSAADCQGPNQACLGSSCVPVTACKSSVQCPGSLVCAAANGAEWPLGVLGEACQECATNADCPAENGCEAGFCDPVCATLGLKCGDFAGVVCGSCPGSGTCDASTGLGCYTAIGDGVGGTATTLVATATTVWYSESFYGGSAVEMIDRSSGMGSGVGSSTYGIEGPVMNSTDVYWFSPGTPSTVSSMPLGGGAPVTFGGIPGTFDCYKIAVDDQNFYCFNGAGTFGIYAAPLSGGSATQISAESSAEVLQPFGGYLYWTDGLTVGATPVAGGGDLTLATSGDIFSLAVDAQGVYWVDGSNDLYQVGLTGGTPVVLAAGSVLVFGQVVAAVGGKVYVTSSTNAGLVSVDETTGTQTLIGDSTFAGPFLVESGDILGYVSGRLSEYQAL